jgi:mono/diheme cytochrome c family protein
MKTAALTLLVLLACAVTGAYIFISVGAMPANADAKPPALERWAAHRSLKATIARQAPKGDNPLKADDANLLAGIKLYAENCAVCHGAADGQASNIAKGLYQHAPQLAKHGVEDDEDGETYWKIYHGIRLTGMPAYRESLSEKQVWQLTLFLKHMEDLTPAAEKAWKALPSQAPKIKAEG